MIELSENTLAHILLTEWGPPAITVIIGGYLGSVLFPRLQKSFQLARQKTAKRLDIAEQICAQFDLYVVGWRRLIAIAQLEDDQGLSETQRARKHQFVEERNARRDDLNAALGVARIYFSANVIREIESFCRWDEQWFSVRLQDLPEVSEWRNWERRIVDAIRGDLEI